MVMWIMANGDLGEYEVVGFWWPLMKMIGFPKVNVALIWDFYVENIHVKLQNDTGNLWRVIAFTRFRTPPDARPGNDNTLQPKGPRGQKCVPTQSIFRLANPEMLCIGMAKK